MTSIKKFGSRLTSILPGRRSAIPTSVNKGKGKEVAVVDVEIATATHNESTGENSTAKASLDGRAFLTTYENSGMDKKCFVPTCGVSTSIVVSLPVAIVSKLLIHQTGRAIGPNRTAGNPA